MKTTLLNSRTRQRGWALLIVMSLAATGLLLVASVMNWANENAAVTARNNEYFVTTYAAEAATEKALGSIVQDDQNYGQGWVYTKNASSSYNSLIPTASDSSYWTNYQFSGGTNSGAVLVECLNTNVTNFAGPPYSGLQYIGYYYEIIANAKNLSSMYGITATVGQQIVLGQIPIFQFAIFYNDTLEIDPGAIMNINGTVHCNTNIYIDPSSLLTFSNDVSATGTLNLTENPLDPSSRTTPTPANMYVFNGSAMANVNPLNLPVGTNVSCNTTNSASAVNAILQPPPPGEDPGSTIGTNRLYNQVDLIITISNNNVITVTSGINEGTTVITNNQWASFVSTNGSFYSMRDGIQVDPVDIDVGALRKWSATNKQLRPLLAAAPSRSSATADVQAIYVLDQRFLSNTVIITNYTYTTNTASTTSSNYPGSGTYYPPVTTNTTTTTSSALPTSGTYVPPILSTNVTSTNSTISPTSWTYMGSVTTNNTTNTSTTYPTAGTYTGTVTTNTTVTTSNIRPAAGTYVGTITTNKTNGVITGYTYNLITGYTSHYTTYTYNLITGYIFNGITGYTFTGITGVTTNTIYTTNYVQYAEQGIVLTNGATLPSNGLSVVTPDPLYIAGNWNVTNNSGQGKTQTYDVSDTLPSAVYADAVTILSPAWNPNSSTNSLTGGSRTATPDTVNAAILTGIIPLQRHVLQRRGGKLPAFSGELARGQFILQRLHGGNVHQPDRQ